jgi:hypothetical protein
MTEPELRECLKGAVNGLVENLPSGTQFILIACDDSNIGQYISTMSRAGCIFLLRETADRLAAREDVTR